MRSICAIAAFMPVVALATGVRLESAIFGFTDSQGVTHYSNVPVDDRYRIILSTPLEADKSLRPVKVEPPAVYRHLIKGAAVANRLEPALVTAVILAESGGDPHAVSKRGACGLMQLMPETARRYGVRNLFDPEQNIRGGSRYLRDLTQRYRNDLRLVLAAYNAGPEAVDRQGGGIPPYRETLEYVPRVLRLYHQLLELTREPP